jgi:hypothetical protein
MLQSPQRIKQVELKIIAHGEMWLDEHKHGPMMPSQHVTDWYDHRHWPHPTKQNTPLEYPHDQLAMLHGATHFSLALWWLLSCV